jgi:hypothetical protein
MTDFEIEIDNEIQAWHKSGKHRLWRVFDQWTLEDKQWGDMYPEEQQRVAELFWQWKLSWS